ncbi:hypothetical protein [Phenylobacterium kunshanense]|uniref:hypothetical protein n=1 Tax=Phenylobacterium kunshanense TaxID=1445034 RepID=UPI001403CC14|nr:hypothetical protein [Phenylobacterium kunshanense]
MTVTRAAGVTVGLLLVVGGGISLWTTGAALGLLAIVVGMLIAALSAMAGDHGPS